MFCHFEIIFFLVCWIGCFLGLNDKHIIINGLGNQVGTKHIMRILTFCKIQTGLRETWGTNKVISFKIFEGHFAGGLIDRTGCTGGDEKWKTTFNQCLRNLTLWSVEQLNGTSNNTSLINIDILNYMGYLIKVDVHCLGVLKLTGDTFTNYTSLNTIHHRFIIRGLVYAVIVITYSTNTKCALESHKPILTTALIKGLDVV